MSKGNLSATIAANMTDPALFFDFLRTSFGRTDRERYQPMNILVQQSIVDMLQKALYPESISDIDYKESVDIFQERWEKYIEKTIKKEEQNGNSHIFG